MNKQVLEVMADMSQLMWEAKVRCYSALEVKQRFEALQQHHLQTASDWDRPAVSDELDLWSGRIAQLFNPAFIDQAI